MCAREKSSNLVRIAHMALATYRDTSFVEDDLGRNLLSKIRFERQKAQRTISLKPREKVSFQNKIVSLIRLNENLF